jgi:CHAT domain-containing protein
VKVILLSPDGPFNGLPWAALPGSKPGTFLLHEHAFAVIPVPQLLPESRKNEDGQAGQPALLAIGDVDFDASLPGSGSGAVRVNSLPLLKHSRAETDRAVQIFKELFPAASVVPLLGQEATREAFVRLAPKHSHLAVATHGFFLPEPERLRIPVEDRTRFFTTLLTPRHEVTDPALRSGLVFAGANWQVEGRGSAFLTALEVGELDLRHVDLAVLSACETGLGTLEGGEGVLGLQRAFQLAGARTTVTSLWKVADDATQALMTEFYRNLWQKNLPNLPNLSKLESLRQAQLTLLRDYGLRGREIVRLRGPGEITPVGPMKLAGAKEAPRMDEHELPPFYWAAFVLSGDWR